MSSTLAPTGLRPVRKLSSGYMSGGFTEFPLTTDNSAALAMGDPVAFNAGTIASVTDTPTTTRSANTPVGVFMGASYIDPVTGLHNTQYLPASAVTKGYTNIKVYVCDDPNMIFECQADGAVAASNVGAAIALKNFGAADSSVKTSRVELDHTTIVVTAAATTAMKIHGIVNTPGNVAGDTYTRVLVRWNFGVHQYQQSAAGTA